MAVRASYESVFRKSQDYAAALVAVQRVRDVDAQARDGTSLLGMAAYYGHADACAWILDRGGAIDIRDAAGRTPLLTGVWALSAKANQEHILAAVRLLLERGAAADAADDEGLTVLHHAVSCVDAAPELVEELLARGADPSARSMSGQTVLTRAARDKHVAGVRALLAHGADPRLCDGQGRDALSYALEFDSVDLLNRHVFDLVGCFVDVPSALAGTDDDLRGRLFVAAGYAGRVDVVQRCLADGMSVDVCAGSRSILDSSVWADNRAMFDLLVDHGADVNTMLHTAVEVGIVAAAEWCLRSGADPNMVDGTGTQPILVAAYDARPAMLELLAGHDADLNATLRHAAGGPYSTTVTAWCLDRGADPNAAGADGRTALHLAVQTNEADKVRLLVSRGADPAARDHQGRLPIDLVQVRTRSMSAQFERDEIQTLLAAADDGPPS
ncbi:ankyrin repeat domain-containing protein [Virgisporangium aurantiacum]|uniref:Ankyrin repeat-containing protein n=1 Tax=Virgisporangium aurantiacum TaxID=175570 RepID=A0A8J4E7V2_9ACTN|nr:ankyrin repeat domain-containing protein [Virgisporangium aurantiacum]GIJ64704.1 hypothetical protein Vau01_122200 [Virgisporangium aurantiacum]